MHIAIFMARAFSLSLFQCWGCGFCFKIKLWKSQRTIWVSFHFFWGWSGWIKVYSESWNIFCSIDRRTMECTTLKSVYAHSLCADFLIHCCTFTLALAIVIYVVSSFCCWLKKVCMQTCQTALSLTRHRLSVIHSRFYLWCTQNSQKKTYKKICVELKCRSGFMWKHGHSNSS